MAQALVEGGYLPKPEV